MSIIGQPWEDDMDDLTAWCADLLDQVASLQHELRRARYARSRAEASVRSAQDEIAWRTA